MPNLPLNPLERWLIDASGPLPPVEQLRSAGVAAYACTRLEPGHPARAELHGDLLAGFARHLKAKAELLPLLRAWHDAGVEVLLFKGFSLSEFTYPLPGVRWYSDVDLLIRPPLEATARQVALDLGWAVRYDGALDVWSSHTLFTLQRGGGIKLDVHRWPVHAVLPWHGVHRRITEAVWHRSSARAWEGITVRLPDPVDALLVGLILQRSWGDDYHLRANHLIDFQLIEATGGVSRAALRARARQLRCERTLNVFLQQCDPSRGRLSLMPMPEHDRQRLGALFADRTDVFVQRFMKRGYQFGPALRWLPRALLAVRRTRRALRAGGDAAKLGEQLADRAVRPRSFDWTHAVWTPHAVHWALQLARVRPAERAQAAPLVLFTLLRQEGWPAELVGVGEDACVELHGRTLRTLSGTRRAARRRT